MDKLIAFIEGQLVGNEENVVMNSFDEGYKEGYEDALNDILDFLER